MKTVIGALCVVVGVLLIVTALSIPSVIYEESPPPFGTASVYSQIEYKDPVAGFLTLGGLCALGGGTLLLWPRMRWLAQRVK